MCGIAGFYSTTASISSFDSDSARQKLLHRGPDDSGVFQSPDDGVALVHSRLAIQDLSQSGHQPMLDDGDNFCLVYNGEIYNFHVIRARLQSEGVSFQGDSDTEVLLKLYISFFSDVSVSLDLCNLRRFLSCLNGIFSFAIWDRLRQVILVVRDPFGVKPLYYFHDHKGFFFSSEIKSLPTKSCSLDALSLERYLTYLWCPGIGTPVKEISKVAPGEALLVSNGLLQQKLNWYLPRINTSLPGQDDLPVNEIISHTGSLLRQAVHRQMIADVPVGSFLSGGLDSSSIVAFAKEINPNIKCFSIDFPHSGHEGFSHDLPFARKVADHLNVDLEIVRVEHHDIAAGLESMIHQLDEPLADPAALNVLYISQLAKHNGINVLLSGTGGDDLFTGYRRHLALNSEYLWSWVPRKLLIGLRQLTANLPASNPLLRRLRKVFSACHLQGDARLVHYFRWIERADLHALYSSSFRSALGQAQAEDPMLDFLADLPSGMPDIERMLALEQRFFLADHNLMYTDKMSMAVGVEVRVPFLDQDLVEFADQIPAHFKQRGRHGKWILKKAMEPYLPKNVIYRPKSGFGVPLRRWLQVELRDWLADILSAERLQSRGLFDPQAVQRLIVANADGRIDASYTLFSLACIEVWCTYFLDSSTSSTLRPNAL